MKERHERSCPRSRDRLAIHSTTFRADRDWCGAGSIRLLCHADLDGSVFFAISVYSTNQRIAREDGRVGSGNDGLAKISQPARGKRKFDEQCESVTLLASEEISSDVVLELESLKDLKRLTVNQDQFIGMGINVNGKQFDDAGMGRLKGLTKLEYLSIPYSQITDAGLEHLKGFTKLEFLDLNDSQITDTGLGHLKGLLMLRHLALTRTKVGDVGLEHLKELTNLRDLRLGSTRITGAGLKHLEKLTSLTFLWINKTQVTDAGLDHLKHLTSLEWLDLGHTQVSDAGMEHLKGLVKLRGLILYGTQISDVGLEHLKQLPSLGQIGFGHLCFDYNTRTSAEGRAMFRNASPKCLILPNP